MQPKSLFLGTELKENYLVLINAQLVGNKVLVSTTLSKYEMISSHCASNLYRIDFCILYSILLTSVIFLSTLGVFSLLPIANVNDVIWKVG